MRINRDFLLGLLLGMTIVSFATFLGVAIQAEEAEEAVVSRGTFEELVITGGNSVYQRAIDDNKTWMYRRVTRAGVATWIPLTPAQARAKRLPQ